MNKTYQFQSILTGDIKYPIHSEFMDAWNDMYKWVNDKLTAGNLSLQTLETPIWIEVTNERGRKFSCNFYDCRDKAIDDGWVKPN